MVKIDGKYKLVENKGFYEFLLTVDFPEEKAKGANEIKGTLEVKLDGKKITMSNDVPPYSTDLIVGEEVEEKLGGDVVLKSTASISDNVITITSKIGDDVPAGSRTFNFSDDGLEMVITVTKEGKTNTATRIFKRI